MESKTQLDSVIAKGINYLISQHKDGRWQGFPTMAGTSDIWVTGFVLTHIHHLITQKTLLSQSQNFLISSRKASGAWSYSTDVPPDADSTAWCLMALQSYSKFTAAEKDKSKKCLWDHSKDHGVATYLSDSGILEFISAPSKALITGWTSAHPDVSIAAALADPKNEKVPGLIEWLKDYLNENGLIASYWWRVPFYTTTLLQRVFALLNKDFPKQLANKIMIEIEDRQLPNGSFALDSSDEPDAFTSAMALESLLYLSNHDTSKKLEKCVHALLQSQKPDGAWEGGFILRIPAPYVSNPALVDSWNTETGGGNSYVIDQNGIFATTMACYGLDCYRRMKLDQNKSTKVKSLLN